MKRLLLLATLGLSCGTTAPPPACGPKTCDGCCDSTDKCRTGGLTDACGLLGVACDVCVTGQVCAAGRCGAPQPIPDGGTDAGPDSGTPDAGTPDAGTPDAGTPDAGPADAGNLCPPKPVTCSDFAIASLDLKKTVNTAGTIVTVAEDGGFRTTIDATAGGFTPTMSFVYGKFSATGLDKVLITDEVSLDSMDWDIAFRRFVIRLNSGSSGPSCVKSAATAAGTSYDTLASVPGSPPYVVDDFEGAPPTCMFKDDGSGLTTSPSTALANANASFYSYVNCVAMTGRVFVVQTREGRHVKLVVTNYYPTDAAQNTCNMGTNPGVAGATIRVRWSYLD